MITLLLCITSAFSKDMLKIGDTFFTDEALKTWATPFVVSSVIRAKIPYHYEGIDYTLYVSCKPSLSACSEPFRKEVMVHAIETKDPRFVTPSGLKVGGKARFNPECSELQEGWRACTTVRFVNDNFVFGDTIIRFIK